MTSAGVRERLDESRVGGEQHALVVLEGLDLLGELAVLLGGRLLHTAPQTSKPHPQTINTTISHWFFKKK